MPDPVTVVATSTDGVLSGSSTTFTTNEKRVDMWPAMFNSFVDATPITVILSKLRDASATNTRIDWTEGNELPREVTHTGVTEPTVSTTITIANWSFLRRDDLLFVPSTEELMRVETTPTSTSVTVERGIGGTTSVVLAADATLIMLVPAKEEAGAYQTPRAVVNTNQYNLTQIVNEFTRVSKSVNKISTWFTPKRQENQQKMWLAFRKKLESTLMFGHREDGTDVQSNNAFRAMGGLFWKLGASTATNIFDVNGLLTESALDQWLEDVYTEVPSTDRLTFVASPFIIGRINQIAKPLIRISPNAKVYGLDIMRYEGSISIDLIRHPLLKGNYLRGMGFLLDLNRVILKWLRKPEMLFDTNIKGHEFIEDKIEAEVSMIIANENYHGFMKGVTG